jgi:hypothetical protein
MSKIRPSEMIQVIDNLFGGGRSELAPGAIKHIHQVEVRALLSLLEDVPRELVQLSTSDLVEFTRCKSVLAAAVGRWTYGDTMPSPDVGGRDPVERIRRLLQKCADELPPSAPELPFISDDPLRVGIENLILSAWTDFKAQEWIGATALAGTALEALLFWRVKAVGAISQRKNREPPTAATGHERRIGANASAAGRPQTADPAGGQGGFRLGPRAASRSAKKIAGSCPRARRNPFPCAPGRDRLSMDCDHRGAWQRGVP